jgi:putative restriction endonuclease
MRFWWVNQNQTYEMEMSGGYLWSPKRTRNGARNRFYDNMKEVSPGDIVFSFVDTYIPAMSVVHSFGYEANKPSGFEAIGPNWTTSGWRVDVLYYTLRNAIRPKDHIARLRSLLPEKYSPLQTDGNGNQGVYLTEVSAHMAEALMQLIGEEVEPILADGQNQKNAADGEAPEQSEITKRETDLEKDIADSPVIKPTTKVALIQARIGQGLFKERVSQVEKCCRITGVSNLSYVIASHIKPWRHSDNTERLDGHNGLLLSPNMDHLFDRGFISFANDGILLISPAADLDSLSRLGVPVDQKFNVGTFSGFQKVYLDFHRREIFKKAEVDD